MTAVPADGNVPIAMTVAGHVYHVALPWSETRSDRIATCPGTQVR